VPERKQEGALNRLRTGSISLDFPIRQAVPLGPPQALDQYWARWAHFVIAKNCIMLDTVHLYTSHLFMWLKGGRNGWMAVDRVG